MGAGILGKSGDSQEPYDSTAHIVDGRGRGDVSVMQFEVMFFADNLNGHGVNANDAKRICAELPF
jgi:hypothetical protein